MREAQTDLRSEIIHLADAIDVLFDLKTVSASIYDKVKQFVSGEAGSMFSARAVAQFQKNLSYLDLLQLQAEGPEALLKERLPALWHDYSDKESKPSRSFSQESSITNPPSQLLIPWALPTKQGSWENTTGGMRVR